MDWLKKITFKSLYSSTLFRCVIIMDWLKKITFKILDSSTIVRWVLIIALFYGLLRVFGFEKQEFKVSILLVWYGVLSSALASFLSYVYGKVNYHNPKDVATTYGQIGIFIGTLIFAGLVILGTYIAQYH